MKIIGLFLTSLLLVLLGSIGLGSWAPLSAQTVTNVTNQGRASFDAPDGSTVQVPSDTTRFTILTQEDGLEITKTGDRVSAEPGDVIVYRLLVRNTGTAAINDLTIVDQLPLGLSYVPGTTQAALTTGTTTTEVAILPPRVAGRQLTFEYAPLAAGQDLTIAYGVLISPDAVRGDGINQAFASTPTTTTPNTSHRVTIRPGIVADCGTLIGRVFVDRNFDGEQQPGEPGVPNAVIFLDDGNRIITDPDGLFSVANVIAGNRVGTLDLTSLPGYTLAPNLYRIEGNSPSRLVRLSPGGLARMNFAVTPVFGEEQGL